MLAGVCFGVGLYHKIDLVAVLAGCGIALLVAYGRELVPVLRTAWRHLLLAALGLLVGLGPMLYRVGWLAGLNVGGVYEKLGLPFQLRTLLAMYDGTYALRLVGLYGDVPDVFRGQVPVHGAFGIAVLAAVLFVVLLAARGAPALRPVALFAITALVLVTLFVLLLPGAMGIHHMLLAYPLPQLVIAVAIAGLLRRAPAAGRSRHAAVAALLVALVLAGDLRVARATLRLVHDTGGRGYWTSAIGDFAREVRDRADLEIVSLDWGFNEQLVLLTDGPRLWEPYWVQPLEATLDGCDVADRIYLAHPPALTLAAFAARYLHECQARHGSRLLVRPYRDRQGTVTFYAIRLSAPPRPPAPPPAGAPPAPRSRS